MLSWHSAASKVLLLLVLSLITAQTNAQAGPNKLIVAITEAPGFAAMDTSGNYVGVTVDYLNETIKRSQLPIEIRVLPGSRALSDFIEGKLPYLSFIRDERMHEFAVPLSHLGSISQVALTPKDKPVLGFDDLKSLTLVGIVRAGVPTGPLVEDPDIKRFEVNDVEVGLRMLMNRRIDALVASKIGIMKLVVDHKLQDFVTWTRVGTLGFTLYAHKNAANWPESQKLSETVNQIVKDGVIEASLDKTFGPMWRD